MSERIFTEWCNAHNWKMFSSLQPRWLSLKHQHTFGSWKMEFHLKVSHLTRFLTAQKIIKVHSDGKINWEKVVTSVKCYFRDDAAVIFKDTSRNYYLLLVLDSKKIELKTRARKNSEVQLGRRSSFVCFIRSETQSQLSCRKSFFAPSRMLSKICKTWSFEAARECGKCKLITMNDLTR